MNGVTPRDRIKGVAGAGVARIAPQCDYRRAILVLAHMRCGSTALSNILCSRSDVSGYGEAHVRHDGTGALGRLLVNQALRRAWRPGARHLFDKVLHSRHDAEAPSDFFAARAIFVAREPRPTIRSIRALFDRIGRGEYATDTAAAEYYVSRLAALSAMWPRFAPDRRAGVTHAALVRAPEAELARISTDLDLTPPLENRYESPAASRRGGGGDPVTSGRHTRIERAPAVAAAHPDPDVPPTLLQAADAAYARFVTMIAPADGSGH